MATPVRFGYSDFGENWKVRKTSCFCFKLIVLMNRTKFWMFQKHSKGIFNISKNQPKKSTNKMATPVRFGYSDFGQNWKIRKTCCFCLKLIVLMKEQNFECFRRIRRVFSTFEKLNQKNQQTKWPLRYGPDTVILVKIEKSAKHAVFSSNWLFWMKEQNFECFRRIRRVFSTFEKLKKKINQQNGHAGKVRIFFNISKNQPKKSTNKMATPVRSRYSDVGQNWKVRKTRCFCFKLIVLMKEQNCESFRRIRRVFSTFEKLNQKNQPTKWPSR